MTNETINSNLLGDLVYDENELFGKKTVGTGETARGSIGSIDMRISFYTNIAIALYKGEERNTERKGFSRAGLTKIDDILKRVYEAAKNDDPYADQLILDMHSGLIDAKDKVSMSKEFLQNITQEKAGNVSWRIKQPKTQSTFNVHLSTPLGKEFFWLLTEADAVLRLNIFAKEIGLTTARDQKDGNRLIANAFHNTFSLVFGWKSTGVTREDVKASNRKAIDAAEKNAKIKLSEEVLNGSTRSTLAPEILIKPEHDIAPLVTPEEKKAIKIEAAKEIKQALNEAQFTEKSEAQLHKEEDN